MKCRGSRVMKRRLALLFLLSSLTTNDLNARGYGAFRLLLAARASARSNLLYLFVRLQQRLYGLR